MTGSFKLRSGAISSIYFDKYLFESQPKLLKEISSKLIELLPSNYDYLGALEMGAIPIATAIALQTDDQVVYVRKEAKEYGTAKFAEGPEIKGKRLCLIEDVVTSGGQLIKSAKMLRNEGAIIDNAVCVIDRESGGSEALNEIGIELIPLFKMSELTK
jgi:orotate phosphoribosyltransferase